jgi:hypothetical protein
MATHVRNRTPGDLRCTPGGRPSTARIPGHRLRITADSSCATWLQIRRTQLCLGLLDRRCNIVSTVSANSSSPGRRRRSDLHMSDWTTISLDRQYGMSMYELHVRLTLTSYIYLRILYRPTRHICQTRTHSTHGLRLSNCLCDYHQRCRR